MSTGDFGARDLPAGRIGWVGAWRRWSAIIGMVMLQEFDDKFKGSRLGTFLTFAEPIIIILTFCLIRGLFRGQVADFGTSLFVFFSSGVFPFYLFLRGSLRMQTIPYDPAQRLPRASVMDYVIASALAEAAITMSSMVVWFFVMWMIGLRDAMPASPAVCAPPLLMLFLLGIGVGLTNSAFTRRFKTWRFLYGRLTYGLIFLSGVFFIADLVPLFIRDVLVWNPLTHAIEWFRLGLYGHYLISTLDRDYLIDCTIFSLVLGLFAHRATLRFEKR